MNKQNGNYTLPSSDEEILRLHRQGATLYGGVEFLAPFLDGRPSRVLDVGSGTGIMTMHAGRRLPDCKVVGVEPDEQRRKWAQQQNDLGNVSFEAGTAEVLPFEDDTFDLVFSRFVLVNVPDPDRSLREMVRVTRPGGRVVTHEMIHDGIWFSPPKRAFSRLLRQLIEVMHRRNMEPSMGLHVASGMIRSGLHEVHNRIWPHTCFESEPVFEQYRRNWIETVSSFDQTLEALFDDALVEQALLELQEQRPDGFLVELTGLATGVVH